MENSFIISSFFQKKRPLLGSLFDHVAPDKHDFDSIHFDINVYRLPAVFLAIMTTFCIASLLLFSDNVNVHETNNNTINNDEIAVVNEDELKEQYYSSDSQPLLQVDQSLSSNKQNSTELTRKMKLIAYTIVFSTVSCVFACCKNLIFFFCFNFNLNFIVVRY